MSPTKCTRNSSAWRRCASSFDVAQSFGEAFDFRSHAIAFGTECVQRFGFGGNRNIDVVPGCRWWKERRRQAFGTYRRACVGRLLPRMVSAQVLISTMEYLPSSRSFVDFRRAPVERRCSAMMATMRWPEGPQAIGRQGGQQAAMRMKTRFHASIDFLQVLSAQRAVQLGELAILQRFPLSLLGRQSACWLARTTRRPAPEACDRRCPQHR